MAKKRSAVLAGASAAQAVEAVKSSPLVQRVVTDEDLHDNVRVAYASARQAYERLSSAKKPPQAVLNDKKFHAQVAAAAVALRDVGNALSNPGKSAKKKRSGGLIRKLLVLIVGAGAAVAVSADLRNKLLDLLFGAEEEFDYTSTTAPTTPPPVPSAGPQDVPSPAPVPPTGPQEDTPAPPAPPAPPPSAPPT
jgi:hypothetical protein